MNPNQTIRCASTIVIAAALGAGALTAAKAADVVQVMGDSTPALPGYGTLMLEIWTDGVGVQGTIMAKLCPAPQADEAHAHAPTDAIAALAGENPCKWRPVALEDLAAMPGVGRRTLVQIGTTVYELREARWGIRPDPR